MSKKTQMQKSKKLIKGFTITELIFTILGSVIALGGFILVILGIVGDSINIIDNPILEADKALQAYWNAPIGFRWLGLILLAGGVAILIIALNSSSIKEDIEKEKEARKLERINSLKQAALESDKVVVGEFTETSSTENKIEN